MKKSLTTNQFSYLLLAKLAEKQQIIDLRNKNRKICSIPSNYKQIIYDIMSNNDDWKEWFSCLIDTKSYFDNHFAWEKKFSESLNNAIKELNKTYTYNFENDSIDIDFTQEEIDKILSRYSKGVLEQVDHFSNLMNSAGTERKSQEMFHMFNKIKDRINEC